MPQEWAPSIWGRLFTDSQSWRLHLANESVKLEVDGQLRQAVIDGSSPLQVHRGLFWTDLTLQLGLSSLVRVDGLPNVRTQEIEDAISTVIAAQQRRKRQETFNTAFAQIQLWLAEAGHCLRWAQDQRRWITHEQQQALLRGRPSLSINEDTLRKLFQDPDFRAGLPTTVEPFEKSLQNWQADWPAAWADLNEQHMRQELVACKDLFDRVESKPLTEEQARAVICFDNRVQVVASAGSGKTSTMVAKAAYAIHRGFVRPDRILLMAFNKKAAEELQKRAARSFSRLGMEGVTVEACTFHALGRRIIGKARGRMPEVPEWAIETGKGLRKLSDIVDQMKDQSVDFRTHWDLFRLVFGRDLPRFGGEELAEEWGKDGVGYVRTMRGERVRSQEECVIADWLFYNGVNYDYEPHYEFDTVTDEHRQYRPDFYYPDIELYHEHFALNAQGEAPPHFTGYLEGVAWKRQEHQRRGTALVETTSHQLRTGEMYAHLGKALTDRGIELDPNPDRPIPENGQIPMKSKDLVGLIRSFISHVKSNGLTIRAMAERIQGMPEDSFKHRHRMFLALVDPILRAWDGALAEEEGIDFEDMLNQAAEHLEQDRYESPYDLVMADEFQDASRARARLCRALVQRPGRHLFAVGDDWQSINRFAGADVSVMTGFRQWFGHGQVLRLEQTFRCPQELCDVSSRFVSKNPAQIAKSVRSATPAQGVVLQAFQVETAGSVQSAINIYLGRLHQGLLAGTVAPGRDGKVSVFILGRYNADQAYVPLRWKSCYGDRMDVAFLTIHRSKGTEADYVLLPGMAYKGFPNLRADDPVLALAMPNGDTYPLGEERRLFYVALTRARRSVAMFTVQGQSSTFLDELVKEQAVTVTDTEGEREHAILWGSLRCQCDNFLTVCGAEARIATTEDILERIVQHRGSHVEEGLHRRPVPAHLLLLVHAFGNDLVDRTLHERGRDRFAIPAPCGVMDQCSLVPLEVGQQFADVVFHAPDTSHAAYRCTPRPAADRRELASASRPSPMPKAPFRTLQPANRLGGQVWVGHAKTASGLQRVFEAHSSVPPVEHDGGIWQPLALQAPQPGVAVAQHRRRRVRGHAGHCERLLERTGCNRRTVAREGEAGLTAPSVDHLAGDHLKVALVLAVPAADVAAIKPDDDGFGSLCRRRLCRFRGVWLHNGLTNA